MPLGKKNADLKSSVPGRQALHGTGAVLVGEVLRRFKTIFFAKLSL
jgi:hypothetical protein